MSKKFLAVGDYLINPEMLTFAVLEPGPAEVSLRLGFATRENDPERDLRLTGEAAKEVLRWLRLNSVFLSTAGGFGSSGISAQASHEKELRISHRGGDGAISDRYGLLDRTPTESSERFLSRTGSQR